MLGIHYNTLWGRIKRAVKILFGNPIYYSDVYLAQAFKKLIQDMDALAKSNLDEEAAR